MSGAASTYLASQTATIASGGTTSGAIECGDMILCGIITPAALTGTAFSIKVSYDGTTYNDLYTAGGTKVSITAAASRFIGLLLQDFIGAKYIKLVSNGAEGATRTIGLVYRGR